MKSKQLIGFIIAISLFTLCGVAGVLTNTLSEQFLAEVNAEMSGEYDTKEPPKSPYIAQIDVTGTIQPQQESDFMNTASGYQHNHTMNLISQLMNDEQNKGIILYVDSPGGTVYESEELYDRLMEYKSHTGRPIWTYMSHYAASGGYMVSLPSDKIVANKNTVTGSIGVIMSGYDMTGLYEKLGIRYISITSGAYKDSSKMTEEQIAIYQSQVDETYESFITKVAESRNIPLEQVRVLADGRTYSAYQALEHNLLDEIGDFEAMSQEMCDTLEVYEIYHPVPKKSFLASLFSNISQIIPKSEAQVLLDAADQMESGVLMYYAR